MVLSLGVESSTLRRHLAARRPTATFGATMARCQTRDGSDNVLRRDMAEGELNVNTQQKLIYMPDQLGSVRDVLDGTTGTSSMPMITRPTAVMTAAMALLHLRIIGSLASYFTRQAVSISAPIARLTE